MLRAGQGPVVELGEIDLNSARATQSGEHCVVQQIFFRLVGILARTSPAGNAYAPLFFVLLKFFRNPRADFCHIASVNCRERGATLIFSLRLLLYSGISVACSLRDRPPPIVTQAVCQFPVQVCVRNPGFLPRADHDPTSRFHLGRFSSSRYHKVARKACIPLYLSFAQRKQF